jgi:Phage integrase, N-terminal SAM-like domain
MGGDIMETSNVCRLNRDRISTSQPALTASAPSSAKPKLLDDVRQTIRRRHYSDRTEKAYTDWIKRYIFFHNKRHPLEMAESEIAQFLSSLATEGRVSASTQNQALNALLFPVP